MNKVFASLLHYKLHYLKKQSTKQKKVGRKTNQNNIYFFLNKLFQLLFQFHTIQLEKNSFTTFSVLRFDLFFKEIHEKNNKKN